MEEEFLLQEIRKLKMAIHQFEGLSRLIHMVGLIIKQEEIPILHILDNIEGLKSSRVKSHEEKQKLLQQHRSEKSSCVKKMESKKKIMEQEIKNMSEKNAILQKENVELPEKSKQLRTDVASGEKRDNASNSKSGGSACRIDRFAENKKVFQ